MGMANVLRLGWLVCALGLIGGCGGGPQDPDLRDLESIGLVTDYGSNAFDESWNDIFVRSFAGDVEVVETLVRVGLIYDVEATIRRIEAGRNSTNSADVDRAIEILQAADHVAARRQSDEEARQLALDNALADVRDSYHEFLTDRCDVYAVIIALCVENSVEVIVQIIEPPDGPRRQFGVWESTEPPFVNPFYDASNPFIRAIAPNPPPPPSPSYVIITQAAGGARICEGGDSYGGGFNDDGALTVGVGFGTFTALVQERGGVEYLDWGGDTYQRVTEPGTEAWEAYERCL